MRDPLAGLQGHLDLQCALDDRGLSTIQRQSFRAPFHISKPHRDAGVLVVNVANPTAGFLAGDRAECRIEVASGAKLLLTTPAANRAFRMGPGSGAELHQRFSVASGGWLEYWPEAFIPQAGTRYRQRTEIAVETGAEMLFFEILAPGRTAAGEIFAYTSLRWETDLRVGSQLAARERYTLEPGGAALAALQARFPHAYYASCFVVTTRLALDHPCWRQIEALQSEDVWSGTSTLTRGGWTIKLLASGPRALRAALATVREIMHGALGQVVPDLRRIAPLG